MPERTLAYLVPLGERVLIPGYEEYGPYQMLKREGMEMLVLPLSEKGSQIPGSRGPELWVGAYDAMDLLSESEYQAIVNPPDPTTEKKETSDAGGDSDPQLQEPVPGSHLWDVPSRGKHDK